MRCNNCLPALHSFINSLFLGLIRWYCQALSRIGYQIICFKQHTHSERCLYSFKILKMQSAEFFHAFPDRFQGQCHVVLDRFNAHIQNLGRLSVGQFLQKTKLENGAALFGHP